MAAEWHRLLELNDQRQAKAIAREKARLTPNKESWQWRAALKAKHRR
jgi:hypothetical protein